MKKEEYLKKLESLLKNVDQKEREAAIEYCEEYFAEATDKSEEEIIQELGSPEAFSKQIVQQPKKHKKWPWIVWASLLLAVLLVVAVLLGIRFDRMDEEEKVITETMRQNYAALEIQGNGDLLIQAGNTTSIEPKDAVVLKEDGKTLEVQVLDEKEVKITLGKEIRKLEVEGLSGTITLKDIDCEEVDLSTESGTIEGTLVGTLEEYAYEIESERGIICLNDQEYTGPIELEEKALKARKLDVDCTSGQVHLVFKGAVTNR